MQWLTELINRYGKNYSTAIIYVVFSFISLLIAIILFGFLHSTGIMKLAIPGFVETAEFGGAFAGFLITLIVLIRSYHRTANDSKFFIRGNVLLDSGLPARGALVFVEGIDRQKNSDVTGWFQIEVDDRKEWTVHATLNNKTAKFIVQRKNVNQPIQLKIH